MTIEKLKKMLPKAILDALANMDEAGTYDDELNYLMLEGTDYFNNINPNVTDAVVDIHLPDYVAYSLWKRWGMIEKAEFYYKIFHDALKRSSGQASIAPGGDGGRGGNAYLQTDDRVFTDEKMAQW